MKMLATAKALLNGAAALLSPAEVAKALEDGIYVSRKVLNGQLWYDWAVKHGVPNPLPADELHVTVMYSTTEVKMGMSTIPISVPTVASYAPGHFCRFGKDDEVLVFAFHNWEMEERHYAFIHNGATPTWPSYRPHMTLSMEAGDYELPMEALQDCPEVIILGGEVSAPLRKPEEDKEPHDLEDEDDENMIVIVIQASVAAAAKAILDAKPEMSNFSASDLHRVAAGAKVTKGVAKRLASESWATDELKAILAEPTKVVIAGKTYVERDLEMSVGPIPEEIAKKLGRVIDAFKDNEEERLSFGWASISTVKGELYKDLQGDTISTKAQRQWLHSMFKGQRAGLMEHEGEPISELVEGIVLDKALQDALGIDLGVEGALVGMHYTCEKAWDMVKTGKRMYSIAGRVLVEE